MANLNFTNSTHRIPCRVFDADGNEHSAVTTCDTDTGVLEQHILQPNGTLEQATEGLGVLTRTVHAPPPLTIKEW